MADRANKRLDDDILDKRPGLLAVPHLLCGQPQRQDRGVFFAPDVAYLTPGARGGSASSRSSQRKVRRPWHEESFLGGGVFLFSLYAFYVRGVLLSDSLFLF